MVPSSNKWLSVWPLVSDLVFMASFHKVFNYAFKHAVGLSQDLEVDVGERSDLSEGEVLGIQKDDHSTWHKQERRRSLKALTWVEAKTTLPNLLLFLHTVGPVMKLHYTLFKYAQLSPEGNAKSYLFDLCDVRVSVTAKSLGELTNLLGDSALWDPLVTRLGPVASWPASFKATARVCIFKLLGQVWRRLVWPCTQWPLRLVPLADPETPTSHKVEIARALFVAAEDTLDPGVSLKVRRLAGTPEALLTQKWQEFLFHAFNNVVLSKAFCGVFVGTCQAVGWSIHNADLNCTVECQARDQFVQTGVRCQATRCGGWLRVATKEQGIPAKLGVQGR